MSSARLTARVAISALLRRVDAAGGSGMILARGDETSGAIVVVTLENGRNSGIFERGIGPDGQSALLPCGPRDSDDEAGIAAYLERRRRNDPDLWIVELHIAAAERFAAETILND